MTQVKPLSERSHQLLLKWREHLEFSNRESSLLKGELLSLDRQLERLINRRLRLSVFGRVGVGKSSLLNALLGKKCFATDVAHGCTRRIETKKWEQPINSINSIDLVDTPGIDEISAAGRARLAARVALQSDLVLLVLDSDINKIEIEALKVLIKSGKPIILVLNRCDQWSTEEQSLLLESIRNRLPKEVKHIQLIKVAAAPRKAHVLFGGKIRSHECAPRIEKLQKHLFDLLSTEGELLLSLNALRQADHLQTELKHFRLRKSKAAAQGLIGRFAALKASGVAANPLVLFDLAGCLACDTALVIQLCKVYGINMGGPAARRLLGRLSGYSALLGGAHLTIQLVLGALRHLLLIAAPFTGGISLASAAPVAIAQAALAVHTTKLTGKFAAKEIMEGSNRKMTMPKTMLRYLVTHNPEAKRWLGSWSTTSTNDPHLLKALLP